MMRKLQPQKLKLCDHMDNLLAEPKKRIQILIHSFIHLFKHAYVQQVFTEYLLGQKLCEAYKSKNRYNHWPHVVYGLVEEVDF